MNALICPRALLGAGLALFIGLSPAAGQSLPGSDLLQAPAPPPSAVQSAQTSGIAIDAASLADPIKLQAIRQSLEAKVDEVDALIEAMERSGAGVGVSAAVSEEERMVATRSLRQWAVGLEGQIRAIGQLVQARDSLQHWRQESASWKGFSVQPPYPMAMVESLSEDVESHRLKMKAYEAAVAIARQHLENQGLQAQAAARTDRVAQEKLRASAGSEDLSIAQWRAVAANWAAQAKAAMLAATAIELEAHTLLQQVEQAQLAFLDQQLEVARASLRFNAEDLKGLRAREDARQHAFELEMRVLRGLIKQAQSDVDSAQSAAPGEDSASQLRSLQSALAKHRRRLEVLSALKALSELNEEMWARRYDAVHHEDAKVRVKSTTDLREIQSALKTWRVFAAGQIDIVHGELVEHQKLMLQGTLTGLPLRYEQQVGESLREQSIWAQELVDTIARSERALERWLGSGMDVGHEQPLKVRLANGLASVWQGIRAVWDYEIVSVEDTVEVSGQKVTTKRGISVGKSLGALLIFAVGLLIARRLSWAIQSLLVSRMGVDAAQARTVRRWLFTLAAAVLGLLTLNIAHIPLTVFAFLGGALAIGFGFGMQTVIKNFVSGLILLMERQLRVGDIVSIDGGVARVEEVNLRSSTLKGFDGVDVVVPNSFLLEGTVKNWTLGSSLVRRQVNVGVVYGSDVAKVRDTLLLAAHEVAGILNEPPALVLLEDFAESSLQFALYFWTDAKGVTSGPQVMSDLRFVIDRLFTEHGISMAFPQREVRLYSPEPVSVKVIPSGSV